MTIEIKPPAPLTAHPARLSEAPATDLLSTVQTWIEAGGPLPSEYARFDAWLENVTALIEAGQLSPNELAALRQAFGPALSPVTMMGAAATKARGYAGDFEMIDAIYLQRASNDMRFHRWDEYFHAQAAPRAVRNRKSYFHGLLAAHQERIAGRILRVLNVASGPGRDMQEWLAAEGDGRVEFDCVDQDSSAIAHARQLCAPWLQAIRFHEGNALRFNTQDRFDLVWSAGLFDYLNDGLFVRLLRRFLRFAAPGGEVVIGNFGTDNPTRPFMELLGDWHLIHRSRDELRALALEAGADPDAVRIGAEPEGVNLFLHIRLP